MKAAQQIEVDNERQKELRSFDLTQIDAADGRDHFAVKYMTRLDRVLDTLREYMPAEGNILELGSAQANLSLLLAEEGYKTLALDIDPSALQYAHKKYEHGTFRTVCGDVRQLPIQPRCFDAVVIGELLEHCPAPEDVIRDASSCLKPGGVIVITTPNGERFGGRDPTRSQVLAGDCNSHGEPGGITHLYEFTAAELKAAIADAGLHLNSIEYCANLIHSNRLTVLKRLLTVPQMRALSDLFCKLPVIGRRTAITLIAVARLSPTATPDAATSNNPPDNTDV